MKIPVVPGDGSPPFEIDSDDYPNLVLIPELIGEIHPTLWQWLIENDLSPTASDPVSLKPRVVRAGP